MTYEKAASKKKEYVPKPYEQMKYPGIRHKLIKPGTPRHNFPMRPLNWKSPKEMIKEYELKKSA